MFPRQARLPNGRRHFQHGPIDLLIGAEGATEAVEAAHRAAWARFEGVLDELVVELTVLRTPIPPTLPSPPPARTTSTPFLPRSSYIFPASASRSASFPTLPPDAFSTAGWLPLINPATLRSGPLCPTSR